MCEGCGNNSTKNRDKFGKSFCMRSKACKAEAQAHYANHGLEVEMSSAPATPVANAPTKAKGTKAKAPAARTTKGTKESALVSEELTKRLALEAQLRQLQEEAEAVSSAPMDEEEDEDEDVEVEDVPAPKSKKGARRGKGKN
jgi:hypothetical protein